MRSYTSNLVFIDFLFNLLIGFVVLFIMAFINVNPPDDDGVIKPPTKMLIELTWGDESSDDIDLYLLTPYAEQPVFYQNKESGLAVLERDDLGTSNDTYMVNGVYRTIKSNHEVISLNDLPDGEYWVNVHNYEFNGQPEENIQLKITMINPYSIVSTITLDPLSPREEVTALSFQISNGVVVDQNTTIQRSLRDDLNNNINTESSQ